MLTIVAYCGQREIGGKRYGCERRRWCDRSVVRSIRRAARGIAEQAPSHFKWIRRVDRTITGRKAPTVFVVTGKPARVALRVLALHINRTPAVLKIVTTLLAHEAILNAAKINPGVRELVHKKRTRIKEIVTVNVFP